MGICKNCGDEITENNIVKCGLTKDGQQKYRPSVCKVCHSIRVNHDSKNKLVIKDPASFVQCLDCLDITHIRFIRSNCKCGSANLERCDS